jgi:gas vesicle protein
MNFIGALVGVVIGAVASVVIWIADARRDKR